jgi:hypothetical protein
MSKIAPKPQARPRRTSFDDIDAPCGLIVKEMSAHEVHVRAASLGQIRCTARRMEEGLTVS